MIRDEERCKQKVFPGDRFGAFHPHQCHKRAVKDGYCTVHHPDYVSRKREESDRLWEAKRRRWRCQAMAPHFVRALEEIVAECPRPETSYGRRVVGIARRALKLLE